MNLYETRWTPDTCSCSLVYEWDADLPGEIRTHTFKRVERICPAHSGMNGNGAAHYAAVMAENVGKNKIHGKLMEIPDLAEDVVEEKIVDSVVLLDLTKPENLEALLPKTVRKFKAGKGFAFYYTGKDDKRVLHIRTRGHDLTADQRSEVEKWAEENLGSLKAVIL